MREMLFRGRVGNKGLWRFGDLLFRGHNLPYIRERRCGRQFMVNPSTVGQYTGLRDKKGNRIFEGDVLKFPEFTIGDETLPESYGEVFYSPENGGWMLRYKECSENPVFDECAANEGEVVGNIYNIPEWG